MFNQLSSSEVTDHRSLKSIHFIHGRSLSALAQPLSNAHVFPCTSYATSIMAEIYSSKIIPAPYSTVTDFQIKKY